MIRRLIDWFKCLPSPRLLWALWCDRDRDPDEVARRGG
jgi:hypothetical protein